MNLHACIHTTRARERGVIAQEQNGKTILRVANEILSQERWRTGRAGRILE